MRNSKISIEKCLNDLYALGVIQGEHNINWMDEYNLLEYSKEYLRKIKIIADKYDIRYNASPEFYREDENEDEYILLDRMAFDILEMTKDYILNIKI